MPETVPFGPATEAAIAPDLGTDSTGSTDSTDNTDAGGGVAPSTEAPAATEGEDGFGGFGNGKDVVGIRLDWAEISGPLPEVEETAPSGTVVFTVPRPTLQDTGRGMDATFIITTAAPPSPTGARARARGRRAAGTAIPFSVNATSGEVSVLGAGGVEFPLDFEAQGNYSFGVRVTAGGSDGVVSSGRQCVGCSMF